MSSLLVSIHDVAPPTMAASRRWVAMMEQAGVPTSLLVVPGPWRTAADGAASDRFAGWLGGAAAAGHEVVQHGWTHRAELAGGWARRLSGHVVCRGAGEFWALDHSEAALRLQLGRTVLKALGHHADGFVPPGWLASYDARRAIRDNGFRYMTSHLAVLDLHRERALRIPALSHRPGSRAQRLGATLLWRTARARAHRGSSVRLALHPDDLDHRDLVEASLRAVGESWRAGLIPRTYRQFLEVRS